MTGRPLSGLDIAFLCLEGKTTPMHMGGVVIFEPESPVSPGKIISLLAGRAARVPRLRMRTTATLLPPGGAQWVEDKDFDATRHLQVRELVGSDDEDPLASHAAQWMEEPLDLSRPPWQARIVTGLPDGRFALLLKLHHCLTDGAGAFAATASLLDPNPATERLTANDEQDETPARTPLETVRDTIGEGKESFGIASSILKAARPYPFSPLAAPDSATRRLGFVRLDLAELRAIRRAHGGTTNDVLLAIVSGALRRWLSDRGQRPGHRALRALIPVSTRSRAGSASANRLSGYLCELPVHLDDPADRLAAVRNSMNTAKAAGPLSGAGAVPVLAGRIPPPVHRVATRLAGQAASVLFDTVITNVPLPRLELALGGAPLRELYPLVPLAQRHAIGIAAAVFGDHVHIGLQANGAAVADTGSLRDAVLKSTAELYQRSV